MRSRRALHTTPVVASGRKTTIKKFNLADIGEGITECEVIKWSVSPGSPIQAFDPLCEVQSDKASVEITSPFDGIVKEILVQEGEIGKVGSGLCLIEVTEDPEHLDDASSSPPEHPTASASHTPAPITQSEPPKRPRHPLDPSNPNPSRELGSRPKSRNGGLPFGGGAAPLRASDMLKASETPGRETAQPLLTQSSSNADVLATPSVRHFAKEAGVDLGLLPAGSGREGRIEMADIEAYMQRASSAAQAEATAQVNAPAQDKDVVVELGRTRHNMWKAMVKSLEIPHFGYSTTLDITELHNMLPVFNKHIPTHYLPPSNSHPNQPLVNPAALYPAPSPPTVPETGHYTKLTYLPFLLKTLSKAMLEWPLLRSSITPTTDPSSKPTLTVRPNADIAIALSTPTGLYTPTLLSANNHTIYGLASQLKHLSYLGRQKPCALSPKEMPKRGGTITVSNVGAVGQGEWASPVLVPGGGVAIVALGRAKWVWDVDRGNGEGQRRLKLNVSWSADHRVVEGAELAAFVESWRSYVENPARLITESV
ncbi:CoA-dependent acyltransferase [Coprinopsis marcescibilis]|uniref:Dihydrolipoamide acetyltransferase component of pyruvate dehydrogenase complex n=1 Tax=Coprinopsis marcescibilis TaxID=230819 RepID=A0A5C3KFY0_COPMA|nr:CoA-dependent acyltransferase [Coprinopsis marcescibilis]